MRFDFLDGARNLSSSNTLVPRKKDEAGIQVLFMLRGRENMTIKAQTVDMRSLS